jgi:hypothetical protein
LKPEDSPWSEARLAAWEKLRARGAARFIWSHGVLLWGGFMFCFSLAFFQVQHYGSLFSGEGNLPFRIAVCVLVWVFVGILYGRSRWRRNEQIYLAGKAARGELLKP